MKIFANKVQAHREAKRVSLGKKLDASKTNEKLVFNREVKIPGYSGHAQAYRVFLQPTRKVSYSGVQAMALFMLAQNEKYKDNGFIVVGTDFLRYNPKEQKAMICAELMRCNTYMAGGAPYEIMDIVDLDDHVQCEIEDMDPRALAFLDSDRYIVLDAIYGHRTARRVLNRERRLAINSSKQAAKYAAAAAKATGLSYTVDKAAVKEAKKANKEILAAVSKDNAEQKAKANDLEALANEIDDITPVENPEVQSVTETTVELKEEPKVEEPIDELKIEEPVEESKEEPKSEEPKPEEPKQEEPVEDKDDSDDKGPTPPTEKSEEEVAQTSADSEPEKGPEDVKEQVTEAKTTKRTKKESAGDKVRSAAGQAKRVQQNPKGKKARKAAAEAAKA